MVCKYIGDMPGAPEVFRDSGKGRGIEFCACVICGHLEFRSPGTSSAFGYFLHNGGDELGCGGCTKYWGRQFKEHGKFDRAVAESGGWD